MVHTILHPFSWIWWDRGPHAPRPQATTGHWAVWNRATEVVIEHMRASPLVQATGEDVHAPFVQMACLLLVQLELCVCVCFPTTHAEPSLNLPGFNWSLLFPIQASTASRRINRSLHCFALPCNFIIIMTLRPHLFPIHFIYHKKIP